MGLAADGMGIVAVLAALASGREGVILEPNRLPDVARGCACLVRDPRGGETTPAGCVPIDVFLSCGVPYADAGPGLACGPYRIGHGPIRGSAWGGHPADAAHRRRARMVVDDHAGVRPALVSRRLCDWLGVILAGGQSGSGPGCMRAGEAGRASTDRAGRSGSTVGTERRRPWTRLRSRRAHGALPGNGWTIPRIRYLDEGGPTGLGDAGLPAGFTDRPVYVHLAAMAGRDPGRIAVEDGRSSLDRADFLAAVERLARAIAGLTEPGAAVGLLLPFGALQPLAMAACLAAGRPFVFLDEGSPPSASPTSCWPAGSPPWSCRVSEGPAQPEFRTASGFSMSPSSPRMRTAIRVRTIPCRT